MVLEPLSRRNTLDVPPDEREAFWEKLYAEPGFGIWQGNYSDMRIVPGGIQTSGREYEFDIIIYATGFDAITGAYDRIVISGIDGIRLKDVWKDGPQTYLGVSSKVSPTC